MLLLNMILVLALAASTALGSRIADGVRSLRCDDIPALLCKGIQDNTKIRRAGALGLFPFPRVGRSQPERTWMLSSQDYPEFHGEMKRQGLIPFPRVGRAMGEPGNGMWFGPRLGRFSKRSFPREDPWQGVYAPRDLNSRPVHEQDDYFASESDQPEQQVDQAEKNNQ